jgi:hypothetical protein
VQQIPALRQALNRYLQAYCDRHYSGKWDKTPKTDNMPRLTIHITERHAKALFGDTGISFINSQRTFSTFARHTKPRHKANLAKELNFPYFETYHNSNRFINNGS